MQFEHEKFDVLLNTAEGNGKRQRPSRAKSFDDARVQPQNAPHALMHS